MMFKRVNIFERRIPQENDYNTEIDKKLVAEYETYTDVALLHYFEDCNRYFIQYITRFYECEGKIDKYERYISERIIGIIRQENSIMSVLDIRKISYKRPDRYGIVEKIKKRDNEVFEYDKTYKVGRY